MAHFWTTCFSSLWEIELAAILRKYEKNSVCERDIDPHAPVAQKVADEVVFRRFQGEEVEFFF